MSNSRTLSRRDFLRFSGGAIGLGLVTWLVRPSPVSAGVLPPGATEDFSATCLRCGRCVSACDKCGQQAISTDVNGRPRINGIDGWCDYCMLCVEICPSGALQPVDVETPTLGKAVIDRERCIAWQWAGCRLCAEKCADLWQAIWIDEEWRPHIDETLCTGLVPVSQFAPSRPNLGAAENMAKR